MNIFLTAALAATVILSGCVAHQPAQRTPAGPQAAPTPPQASFQLKEFQIGEPLAACPAYATQSLAHQGMTVCTLGATTIANQPVTDHSVYIFEGRVSGANYSLAAKGRYSNGAVRNALVEKYGPPHSEKPHINEALWFRSGQILRFDGWSGSVGMLDRSASSRASKSSASKDKADL